MSMSTTMEWTSVLPYAPFAILGILCLLIGFALGARRSRAVKRRVLRDLNSQSLELLDTRTSLQCLEHYASQQERKDRLLVLTLKKLQQAEARCRQLDSAYAKQKRKHYVDMSRLRLEAVESRELAVKAAQIARRATARLQRVEQASPGTQSISVSNCDAARLTKLKNGSEINAPHA
jgi:sulfite reductase alpha subunit-like flavoprotein